MIVLKHFRSQIAYRVLPDIPVLSLYRSVVFHPTKEVVLPGVLSQAYTLDGDLKPLFPASNCIFNVCSICRDKNEMLTDCLNDAKCIVNWSLIDGSEIARTTRNEDVFSFAWSRDGSLLAMSYSSGSICLVDVTNNFETLAQTTSLEVCGMIRFSPDHRVILCYHKCMEVFSNGKLFRVKVNKEYPFSFSLDICCDEVAHVLGSEYDSPSECSFLLGDPFPSLFDRERYPALEFVSDTHTLLRIDPFSTVIEMMNAKGAPEYRQVTRTRLRNIAFSLNGETVYAVTDDAIPSVTAWDVSSGEVRGEKRYRSTDIVRLVPVRQGVMLTANYGDTPELWNCQLSKCIRSWPRLHEMIKVIPISEDRVACVTGRAEVNIIDTTSVEIVSTIPTDGRDCIACNSKCQVITSDGHTVQLSDGTSVLWVQEGSFHGYGFSPGEQFVLLYMSGSGLFVLDADSGSKLCSFSLHYVKCCEFISVEEIVVSSFVEQASCLHLFNVKSGELLSVLSTEKEPSCLAACRRKRLVAVGLQTSNSNYKLIHVKLPRDKDSPKNNR